MNTNPRIDKSTNSQRSAWNWREQREKNAFLALEDGTVFRGYSVGAPRDAVGEVVFNTGMTGYQEILSDPSYAGQFVTMTYTEIGNTGVNPEDMESRKMFLNGFVIHEMNEPSNWRSRESLREALIRQNMPAIAGIDTRELTSLLREKGTMKGYMRVAAQHVGVRGQPARLPETTRLGDGQGAVTSDARRRQGKSEVSEEEAVAKAREWEGLDDQDYASRVSCEKAFKWDENNKLTCSWGIADELPPADLKIAAYDFGIKWNILRSMRRSGMDVTVVPAKTSADEVMAMKPDGVFLSNGPGDPDPVTYGIEAARTLLGKVPMMGICLGHQILGLAMGGKRYRLKFGHHGCNHPVKDQKTSKVEITSQNHNFAIDAHSLGSDKVEVTHINLNDQTVEGFEHKREPMFCVQYHPEACPGPHDSYYLFARFRKLIENA